MFWTSSMLRCNGAAESSSLLKARLLKFFFTSGYCTGPCLVTAGRSLSHREVVVGGFKTYRATSCQGVNVTRQRLPASVNSSLCCQLPRHIAAELVPPLCLPPETSTAHLSLSGKVKPPAALCRLHSPPRPLHRMPSHTTLIEDEGGR